MTKRFLAQLDEEDLRTNIERLEHLIDESDPSLPIDKIKIILDAHREKLCNLTKMKIAPTEKIEPCPDQENEVYIRANISRLEEMIKECPEDNERSSLQDMLEQFQEQLIKLLDRGLIAVQKFYECPHKFDLSITDRVVVRSCPEMARDEEFVAQIDADFMRIQTEQKIYLRTNIERLEHIIKECVESDGLLLPIDKIEIILEGYRKVLRDISE